MFSRAEPFAAVRDEPSAEALALCATGEVVDVAEACRRLKMTRPTLYKHMDSGALGFIQDGVRCRRTIPVRELERFNAMRFKPATI